MEAQIRKPYRIGFLGPSSAPENASWVEALRHGLRELGDVEGQNIVIEPRYADGHADRLPDLAAELVRLNVDVIVAPNNPAVAAAQRATRTIPIVMVAPSDLLAPDSCQASLDPEGISRGCPASSPRYAANVSNSSGKQFRMSLR